MEKKAVCCGYCGRPQDPTKTACPGCSAGYELVFKTDTGEEAQHRKPTRSEMERDSLNRRWWHGWATPTSDTGPR